MKEFLPNEIIFAATSACNLKCNHCFVNQNPCTIDIEKAVRFLENIKKSKYSNQFDTVGFSGGEPFLNKKFLVKVIEYCRKNDFMFDRIMTNGVWWNNELEMQESLKNIYDAGFDGKIGISYDSFHNQDFSKLTAFIEKSIDLFGIDSIEIQSVVQNNNEKNEKEILQNLKKLSKKLNLRFIKKLDFKTKNGIIYLSGKESSIKIYRTPQTFQCENENAWKAKHWFEEDFCEGPGNILYIHPNGKIAPCCGFANENEKLFIGNINDSIDEILENAKNNNMIKICFSEGLSSLTEKAEAILHKKTNDECSFCDWICKNYKL